MTDLIAEGRALLDALDAARAKYHAAQAIAAIRNEWHAFEAALDAWDKWAATNARALLDRCEALQRERDAARQEIGKLHARLYAALQVDAPLRKAYAECDALQRKLDDLESKLEAAYDDIRAFGCRHD